MYYIYIYIYMIIMLVCLWTFPSDTAFLWERKCIVNRFAPCLIKKLLTGSVYECIISHLEIRIVIKVIFLVQGLKSSKYMYNIKPEGVAMHSLNYRVSLWINVHVEDRKIRHHRQLGPECKKTWSPVIMTGASARRQERITVLFHCELKL